MTAQDRVDAHWHLQAGLLDMPGIELNLIGKVESFEQDFMHVLDHVQANDALRADVIKPANSLTMSIGEVITRTNSLIAFTTHTSLISTDFNILAS